MPDVGLFVGIESYSWGWADFNTLIGFCKANGITSIVLKVYEITQGDWYQQLGGPLKVVQYIANQGINVLPYAFLYGNDPTTEIEAIDDLLVQFNHVLCLDMESGFDGKPDLVQKYANALVGEKVSISTWANPITHNWTENITILDPVVNVWMPQCYTDALVKDMYAQFPKVQASIHPTFDVVNTPVADASIYTTFTLWEYQSAQNAPQLNSYLGKKNMTAYPTNSKGMVANFLAVDQFQPNHSEYECGAFAVALAMRSTNYNVPNPDNPYNLIQFAESEYAKYAGSNAPSNAVGASVDDMHHMILDTGNLHYWDTDISPSTKQAHDIGTIKAALEHGYTVIATVSEQSVYDLQLKSNPYWWGPSGNHIITYVGIDSATGNLLVVDPANVIKGDGNLQTPKSLQPWPRVYDITRLDNQWATIIKTPWLPAIPSGDPLSWPAYTPPPPTPPPDVTEPISWLYDETAKQLIAMSGVTALYRIQL